MAWIRWRETGHGVRLASLQWRDEEGKVHSQALRTSDPRLATMHLDALERRLGETRRARPREVSPREAVEDFLKEKALSTRPDTVEQYRRRLTALLAEWGRLPLADWTRKRYVRFLAKKTWSPRSIQLMTFICRNFIRWAHQTGVPIPDFVQDFRAPALHQREPAHLEAKELRQLLDAVRDRPIETAVALCALAGTRLNEARRAQWSDVDWAEGMLLVHGTKTHTDRTVPLCGELREVLERHRAKTGAIYAGGHTSMSRTLLGACRRARIRPVSWHPLRHTFATRLLAAGADLATVQALLGHRTATMTMRYTHSSPDRKRAAVERMGREISRAS